ncbi:MAG TPA: class I SAM-dependent methyltransferase [Candidatus Krumholzibacteria bacterium]|nr:class I SAM-dependent methyltransferase [Candidatus Krumholzibacteria bacterium]
MPSQGTIDHRVELPPELACPRCRGPLRATARDLVCAQHGQAARRGADGALLFADDSLYWGEIERASMRQILEAARHTGWQEALRRHLQPPSLLPYVQHPSRADWRVLVPLERERTVSLDVGAGWGAVSFGLAPHVLRHYAVERVAERLEFIALRQQQDGVANLVPVRADLHALPLCPGSLDLVAVNGVLEWAGLVDPEPTPGRRPRAPDVLQEAFLRQLHALLRPGGWLYVGIENRYGRVFWRGTPDHQGLRFTSLMPRRLARAYTRLRAAHSPRTFVAERDYRTWTYSLRGYRRLFARCGFRDLQAYAVVPGYNAPMQLVPLAQSGPFLYLTSRLRSPRRGLGPLRRAAHLLGAATGWEAQITSCYAFILRTPEHGA